MDRRELLWGTASLALTLGASPADARQQPKRWALLVGVSDYKDETRNREGQRIIRPLKGPTNDIAAIRQLLVSRYGFSTGAITVLANERATHTGILAAWDDLIGKVQPGDQVFFFYSGHGVDIPDPTKPDGRGSALCPYDTTAQLQNLLPGPEIGKKIDRLPTDRVVVIVDACHSGTASRIVTVGDAPTRSRRLSAPRDLPGFTDADFDAAAAAFDRLPASARDIARNRPASLTSRSVPKEIYLGASATDETAADAPLLSVAQGGNPWMGAFTFFLLEALRSDPQGKLSYEALVARVAASLRRKQGDNYQTPQLYGSNPGAAFLSLPRSAPPPIDSRVRVSVLSVSGDEVALQSLVGAALTVGSLFRGSDESLVRLTKVDGLKAEGKRVRGSVAKGATLSEALHAVSTGPYRIAILGKRASAVKAVLARRSGLELVSSIESGPDLALYADDESTVRPYVGAFPLAPVSEDDVAGLVRRLRVGKPILALQNPSPAIRLTVTGNGQEGFCKIKIAEMKDKSDKVKLAVTADRDCHLLLIGVGSDGISGTKKSFPLTANNAWSMEIKPFGAPGLDIVKVIALSQPATLTIPASEEEVRESDPEKVGPSVLSQLQRLLNEAAPANDRGAFDFSGVDDNAPVTLSGWGTVDFLVPSERK